MTVQIIKKSWNGINIEIHYARIYFKLGKDYTLSHIDLYSECERPLPITETGYRSHFFEARELEGYKDIWAYVLAWLNHEAENNKDWKIVRAKSTQLSLF
ncbi:MAG: hypothetical protein LCH83_01140 [Proteobacteria bacterium]|nr:hypothetical protein [Pseudomonadota bacterium]